MSWNRFCTDAVGVCGNRIRTVSAGQKTTVLVTLQLADVKTGQPPPDCAAMPVTPDPFPPDFLASADPLTGFVVSARDLSNSVSRYFNIPGRFATQANKDDGLLTIDLAPTETCWPGIWYASVDLYVAGVRKATVPFLYEIMASAYDWNANGPLGMYEIRLIMRDVCPEGNEMIDAVDFEDHEIAYMLRRPIDQWNELPPPVGRYSPATFPYRYHWGQAVCGELLTMKAQLLLRNHLPYSAGGITVDDTGRWKDCLSVGDKLKAEWLEFARKKKVELNIQGGFARIGGYPTGRRL